MILRLFCVVSAAVIHECGHILAAKLCGVRSWRFGVKAGGALITFDFPLVVEIVDTILVPLDVVERDI